MMSQKVVFSGAVWEMCNISKLGVLLDEDKIAVSKVTEKVL